MPHMAGLGLLYRCLPGLLQLSRLGPAAFVGAGRRLNCVALRGRWYSRWRAKYVEAALDLAHGRTSASVRPVIAPALKRVAGRTPPDSPSGASVTHSGLQVCRICAGASPSLSCPKALGPGRDQRVSRRRRSFARCYRGSASRSDPPPGITHEIRRSVLATVMVWPLNCSSEGLVRARWAVRRRCLRLRHLWACASCQRRKPRQEISVASSAPTHAMAGGCWRVPSPPIPSKSARCRTSAQFSGARCTWRATDLRAARHRAPTW